MKNEVFKINVNGFEAELKTYILDVTNEFKIKKRPLVLICPGGGYTLVSNRESEPIALKYAGMGYHAAVLRYSVSPAVYPTQLLQTVQAWKIILDHAEEWNVIPDKIVISGFSAGAHLAASYGIFCGEKFVCDSVGLTEEKLRPAGMILCYPVITSGKYAHKNSFANLLGDKYENLSKEMLDKVSLEKHVTDKTPETFIWHTFTDNAVPVENSLLFATALREHNVNTELHIFSQGLHGLGLANELTMDARGGSVQAECCIWAQLAEVWLKNKFKFEMQ